MMDQLKNNEDPFKDLRSWIAELGVKTVGVAKIESSPAVQIINEGSVRVSAAQEFRFNLFTQTNRYAISAHIHDYGTTYLGCIAHSRKSRAGENWNRGSDLPDGDLSRDTWEHIVRGILHYELVDVVKDRRNVFNESKFPHLY